MTRLRRRAPEPMQPALGTILPGVPLVGRDAGELIPQQRVHDPLSSADRVALPVHGPEPVETDACDGEGVLVDTVDVDDDTVDDAVDAVVVDDVVEDDVMGPLVAVDDELLAAVVKRRPRMPALQGPAVAGGRPAPERLKLMVGVLARDFERFGPSPAAPAAGHRLERLPEPTGPVADWGPWPAPHTSSWPVVVPPWGALPRSFAAPLPTTVTRSA